MTFVKKYDLSDPRDVEKLNKLLNLIGIAEIPHVSISHTWAAYPWYDCFLSLFQFIGATLNSFLILKQWKIQPY